VDHWHPDGTRQTPPRVQFPVQRDLW
jgi:hypothetical protein